MSLLTYTITKLFPLNQMATATPSGDTIPVILCLQTCKQFPLLAVGDTISIEPTSIEYIGVQDFTILSNAPQEPEDFH